MKFNATTILSALLAVTQAAPATTTTTPDTTPVPSAVFYHPRANIGYCGASSFDNETSGASPLVSDCRQIATNIGGGGTWTVGAAGVHHQLVQYGTCAFGVEGAGGGEFSTVNLGNQDIIDLINDSIARFEWNGKVGSKGTMGCKVAGAYGRVDMLWGIYHN